MLMFVLIFLHWNPNADMNSRMLVPWGSQDFERSNWSWLERWMAAKPWEPGLIEHHSYCQPSKTTVFSKVQLNCPLSGKTRSSDPSSFKVKETNMTIRVSVKPPFPGCSTRSASSLLCTSGTPVLGNTFARSDRIQETRHVKPSYMNSTESTKAKQKPGNNLSRRVLSTSIEESQFIKLSAGLRHADASNTGSNNSRSDYLSKSDNCVYY